MTLPSGVQGVGKLLAGSYVVRLGKEAREGGDLKDYPKQ